MNPMNRPRPPPRPRKGKIEDDDEDEDEQIPPLDDYGRLVSCVDSCSQLRVWRRSFGDVAKTDGLFHITHL
jgi:hypothetical protein